MALTEDYEYETMGPTVIIPGKAGAADVLYKGAIVNFGSDGYVKVAEDAANEVSIGVMKKQVVADGSSHEDVEIEVGIIKIPYSGAGQSDVGKLFYATGDDTIATSATNAKPFGLCVDWETGYLWIDTRIKSLG